MFQPFSDEPEALADVRGADARSAQICRPDGVARCFQVSVYSVEPAKAVLARNLLSKDDWRAALCDEAVELRPEVPVVVETFALSGGAEGLAGAGAGPDGPVVGPSGETEGVGPDADTGEEVALGVAVEVRSSHVPNGSFIDISVSDQFIGDQVAQPLRGVGVYLVIVRAHWPLRTTVIFTRQTPAQPIRRAAAFDRSSDRPLMNGPRSLIRTVTDRPL